MTKLLLIVIACILAFHFFAPEGTPTIGEMFGMAFSKVEVLMRDLYEGLGELDVFVSKAKDNAQKIIDPNSELKQKQIEEEEARKKLEEKGLIEKEVEKEESKIVILKLKNSFEVRGKFISERNGNFKIEVDGLEMIFTSSEIESSRIVAS